MDDPIAISMADWALLMRVSRKHVYHLVKTDPSCPKPFKVGRCTRVLRSDVNEWLANKAHRATELSGSQQSRWSKRRKTP
jgi:predicted DNA-binding transcriptional regulator AlpA